MERRTTTLDRAKLEPRHIKLEITESLLMENCKLTLILIVLP